MKRAAYFLASAGCAALLAISPAIAEVADADIASTVAPPACGANGCQFRLTPQQLLVEAERLVHDKNYAVAAPLIDALGAVPELKMQQRFLAGYVAVETGDLDKAIGQFRAILNDDPAQTRVRLELARAYMLQGKEGAADYHFRLAQNDDELPPEIARTIRDTRSILRSQRIWHANFTVGIAPDTNINSATNAQTIDVNFGPVTLPLTLNQDARAKSGVGQTASFSGGFRLRTSDRLALLFDVDTRATNYDGTAADDIIGQVALGPEMRIGDDTSISLQALGQQRWYGGQLASRDFGAKIGGQKILSEGQRVGAEVDARRTTSLLADAYTGWQLGANATYERLIGRSFIASASLFGRRDLLNSKGFSSINYGVNAGIGGELPLGLNAGISGGISRAAFDAPLLLYSAAKRSDWRTFGRAYLGTRQFQFLGFSPAVEYNFTRIDSNYTLYKVQRHRFNFTLARYF